MFTWLKRRTAAPAPQPVRRSSAAAARTQASSRADTSQRHGPRFADTAPLPEVVAEGNTQADWSMWEDSVMALDSQIDTTTGTFKLRSVFQNGKGELWPGQFVNTRLKVRTVKGGLVIPAQAGALGAPVPGGPSLGARAGHRELNSGGADG